MLAVRVSKLPPVIVVLSLLLLLAGCGAGPVGQCGGPCPNPKQWKDWSCKCQGPASPSPRSPIDPRDPALLRVPVQNGCTSFQEHDYVLNFNNFEIDVLIGYQEPNGDAAGAEAWYTVSANATTVGSARDLGLKYVDPNCFDKDYFIKTWQSHTAGAARLAGARVSLPTASTPLESVVQSLDPNSRARVEAQLARFHNETASLLSKRVSHDASSPEVKSNVQTGTRLAARLDCPTICNDPTDFRCLASTPPDGSKTAQLRDRILATGSNSSVRTLDLLKIFGLNNDPCSRGDTSVDGSRRIQNDGNICAYLIRLKKTDANPVASFQIGRNISGYAASTPKGTSVAFTKPNEIPAFIFGQNVLNDDYGGSVLAISADAGAVYINTVKGCISLQVAP